MLAAEIDSFSASQEGALRKQCRQWQDDAVALLYKKKDASDSPFIDGFNLYAVYHEKAKTLSRFSLFHTTDEELLELLKNKHVKATSGLLRNARSALITARKHLMPTQRTSLMHCSITEARLCLIEGEYEECAKLAKIALFTAKAENSLKSIEEVHTIYTLLFRVEPQNPYVCNLGVELGKY